MTDTTQGRRRTMEDDDIGASFLEASAHAELATDAPTTTEDVPRVDPAAADVTMDLTASLEDRIVVDLRDFATPIDRWARPIPKSARFIQDGDGLVGAGNVRLIAKRTIDLAVAAIALLCSLPLMALIALIIRRDGPVIFKQQRVGLDGRKFEMYKFRTMTVRAESERDRLVSSNEVEGPVFKMRKDPRVTRFGYYLRRLSLDELPQLVNVIQGHMSVVGPRPPLPEEVETYNFWELQRLLAKPGLTCIWQVSGRSELDFLTWVAMDVDYIADWSLRNDFELMLATIPALISRRGAY